MSKQRHSSNEIAVKLKQADELSAEGLRQSDIARKLGISLMTLHRWRKARNSIPRVDWSATVHHESEQGRRSDVELDNMRLRRLVTDLLLEKVRLEEMLAAQRIEGLRSRPVMSKSIDIGSADPSSKPEDA